MKQKTYRTGVKVYDPMGGDPMDGTGINHINKPIFYRPMGLHKFKYGSVIGKKNKEESNHRACNPGFKEKEKRIRKYHPNNKMMDLNSSVYSYSEREYQSGNLFYRVIKKIIKKVHIWYQNLNSSSL